jgi:rhamnopyranosyl-N-acetylglucosaminyl-diphospho-decaprenol beta-1,3/1,4-galactofuranosyltransferase
VKVLSSSRPPGATPADSVLATVLTYNDPEALAGCLAAIALQTRRPDAVLVIDNGSSPPAGAAVDRLADESCAAVLRLSANLGPAGGHAAGLRAFLAGLCDVAWVMDDDCVPEPGCLEAILRAREAQESEGVLFPAQTDQVGVQRNFPGWFAVLLPRAVVDRVGVPREEFFWWAEDTEYLQRRISRAGFPVQWVAAARVQHRRRRATEPKPAWKVYYETRNSVYYRLRVQRPFQRPLGMKKVFRLTRALSRTMWSLITESHDRRNRLRMFARGVFDGLRGRLGRTVVPEA